MVNGLGVLGWGVGGIEAEAAMLGEAALDARPAGRRLPARRARCREGATATDLVLTVTELLRKTGVVGKFVEYFGPGLAGLALADRATIGNMSPEYGATCGFFPVDDVTLALPAPDRAGRASGSRSSRPTARRTCSGTSRTDRARRTRRSSSSTSARSSRASPARAARRTASPLRRGEGRRSSTRSRASGIGYGNGTIDESVEDSFPASDPASFRKPARRTMEPTRRQVASRDAAGAPAVATAELDGEELELQSTARS